MIDLKKIEEEMLEFWKKNQIYEKSKKKNSKGKKFYFLQGPPYTSGRLHIGHAWNNNMKDIAMRYFRLTGRNVWDRAGYDMHGLPTENKVQKELELPDKKAIIAYGLDKFAKQCMSFSMNNVKLMNNDLTRLGIWMDFENPYLPVTNDFMSNEWLLIKAAHEQKRLYKGKKVMQWCGFCETSLAKHELEYENVSDKSIYVKFKTKNPRGNEYFVIWTTTPWTIPFNLAIMANPDIDYVRVSVGDEVWIVAKTLASHLIKDILGKEYKIIEEIKGKKLEGLEYIHPFEKEIDYTSLKKKSKKLHTIILSKQYVTLDAGTGLVHCAPGCGPEDYEVGKENGIEAFNTIDEKGVFENAGKFNGLIAKKDDVKFIQALEDTGAIVAMENINHDYAHCWRCHNPVIFKTTEQWFLKTEDLVKKILDYNKKIKWVPKTVQNSYESWITNLKDNGLTRQRFWGTPAPIWECKNEKCKFIEVIGSKEELKEKAITKIPVNLHKPWIDEVLFKCPKCKGVMNRIPDVIDVWIDSGTVSWNCLYYPDKKEYFEKFFPADLILEASEQAHLWFSMLQICSTIVFGKSCYDGIFGHGMILDFQGMKMSKSLGNIISPYEVIDKYSSEILRYYICETKAGENINFNWEDVKQKQRNLLVLMNTANYISQLKGKEDKKMGLEEKYLFSRLNSAIKRTTELFEAYRFDETITEIEKLYLDISRVYIKMTRDKSSESPAVVFYAVKEAYLAMLKMFSTICPLLTESIWQNFRKEGIVKEESVHLTEWPEFDEKKIDAKLEEEFDVALKVIEAGLFARDKAQIGLKWPLAKAIVYCGKDISKEIKEIIMVQLNVKLIELKAPEDKEKKELRIVLDTKMTPELEAEGFAREISRKVQALRKEAGLIKENMIELFVEITDENLREMIMVQEDMIQKRTNAKSVEISKEVKKQKFTAETKDKIKGKDIAVYFNKI
ncbi:MAG: isoleucine--tRNA ligase [Nanoarchaeota archaeon]